ncbi:hypothetical protein Tco_0757134 [Tanacetum coccineum]
MEELENQKIISYGVPWIILEDFNVTMKASEHSNGGSSISNDMMEFIRFGDREFEGHSMYRVVQKLKALKGNLKKMSWQNDEVKKESVRILEEYIEAKKEEYNLLCQKAKVEWIKEGDKNTAYFYKTIKERAHRSRIMSIRNENGVRFKNKEVAKQIVKHSEEFPRPISDAEIKNAMFGIEDSKAPGPDVEIAGIVRSMTNRIKKGLGILVSENQSAFIEGGQITDNIMLSQELFRGYNKKLSVKKVAFKIDLQKAYDTISWNFLMSILVKYLGVPLITKKIGVKGCKPLVDKVIYDIERLLKGFLWCQGEHTKGKAKVSWNSCALSEFIGELGDMYDARLKNDCTISEAVKDGKWCWPEDWNNEFDSLQHLQVPVILNEKEDYAVWVNNLRHEKKFKTGDVWKDICINDPKVECCEFTNGIWTEINKRLNIGLSSVWDNIVQEIIIMPMNNNIWSIIRRLVCAAAVYFVWQERNKRMFGEEKMDSEELIKIVTESVRMKLMGLKVKDSRCVPDGFFYLFHVYEGIYAMVSPTNLYFVIKKAADVGETVTKSYGEAQDVKSLNSTQTSDMVG